MATTGLPFASRWALAAWLVSALLFGACVDTELGLAGTVETAEVSIGGAGPDATVSVTATAFFRVGANADGLRAFSPTRLVVFQGEVLVAEANADVAGSFDAVLEPGEETRFELLGGPVRAPGSDERCGQDAVVRVLYELREGSVSAEPTFSSVEGPAGSIRCE